MRAGWVVGLIVGCAGEVRPDPEAEAPAEPLRFAFPVADPAQIEGRIGVDHDPVVQEPGIYQLVCADYLGRAFPHCYDEHDGSDFLLLGGFAAMDEGSVEIVAAAPGVVERAHDGEYDRCHGTIDGVDCDGHPRVPNEVEVRHDDGTLARYLHMARGSVLVEAGQRVARGEALGRIGSSGNSSMPHLHFEVVLGDGAPVDPYAVEPSASLWCDQGATDALPGPCPGP